MLVPAIRIVLTVGLGLLFASPAPAQTTVGHLSHVEGTVTRLHRFAPGTARAGVLLVEGDQVHVAMGRVEITLGDGSLVQVDEYTSVALHAVDRVQVIEGRVFIRSHGPGVIIAEAGGKRLHVSAGSAAEVTTSPSHDLLVRVVDGDARIESPWGSEAVGATQSAFVSGPTGRPFVGPWVASPHDGFYQWAGGRTIILAPPATFLPYAHPAYRQQEYERVISQRHERRRGGTVTRADRPRATERRDDGETRRPGRRERDRDTNTAQRDDRRPPAKAPSVRARGAGAGVAVRPR